MLVWIYKCHVTVSASIRLLVLVLTFKVCQNRTEISTMSVKQSSLTLALHAESKTSRFFGCFLRRIFVCDVIHFMAWLQKLTFSIQIDESNVFKSPSPHAEVRSGSFAASVLFFIDFRPYIAPLTARVNAEYPPRIDSSLVLWFRDRLEKLSRSLWWEELRPWIISPLPAADFLTALYPSFNRFELRHVQTDAAGPRWPRIRRSFWTDYVIR